MLWVLVTQPILLPTVSTNSGPVCLICGPDRSGYITAEEYERITGEELDEFSTKGRQMIARLAAEYRCTIKVPQIERRVYFTKSK
jgi:hypothetical protein